MAAPLALSGASFETPRVPRGHQDEGGSFSPALQSPSAESMVKGAHQLADGAGCAGFAPSSRTSLSAFASPRASSGVKPNTALRCGPFLSVSGVIAKFI